MEPLIKSVSKALAVGKSEAAARLEIAAGPGVMSFHYNVDEKRKLLLGQGHCLGGVSTSCPRLCGFSPGLQLLPHPPDVHIRGTCESQFAQSEWMWAEPPARVGPTLFPERLGGAVSSRDGELG